ncbi:MAG: DUF1049 domain-containing protein [Myxococcales bacterium]|nr:MAG: DUF1049 domain-containing protein [Myxococcales bacterium]
MLRRIAAIIVFVALVATVALLVHWNAQETSFRLTPDIAFTLPLGILMIAAAIAGAVVMFVLALMREGRHALRDWSVNRELRLAERNATQITEARSLILAGEYKRARSLLKKATQKRAMEISDVIDFAETYLLDHSAIQARKVLEEGQKDFGNEPLLLFALARACRATGDTPAALSALERAVSVYPTSMSMLTMLRDLLFETDSWTRAGEIQSRIVELNPDDASEQNWLLGARYEASNSADEAARGTALKELTNDAPEFLPVTIDRARMLTEAGDWRRAYKLLEKALRRRPRGAVLDSIESIVPPEESVRVARLYSKLVASHPDSSALRLRAAHYLMEHGRVEEAAGVLSAMSENGHGPRALALLGEIHDSRDDTALAHSSYQQALSAGQHWAQPYVCEVCAATEDVWQARCHTCGAWGMFESL